MSSSSCMMLIVALPFLKGTECLWSGSLLHFFLGSFSGSFMGHGVYSNINGDESWLVKGRQRSAFQGYES